MVIFSWPWQWWESAVVCIPSAHRKSSGSHFCNSGGDSRRWREGGSLLHIMRGCSRHWKIFSKGDLAPQNYRDKGTFPIMVKVFGCDPAVDRLMGEGITVCSWENHSVSSPSSFLKSRNLHLSQRKEEWGGHVCVIPSPSKWALRGMNGFGEQNLSDRRFLLNMSPIERHYPLWQKSIQVWSHSLVFLPMIDNEVSGWEIKLTWGLKS